MDLEGSSGDGTPFFCSDTLRSAVAILLLLAAAPARAAPDPPYLGELIAAARAQGLASELQWLRLGHWRQVSRGVFESEADGPGFFLAGNGKTDPAAELEWTLRGFFAPEPRNPKSQHPACKFPARYAWLSKRLGFDPARLPPRSCARFEEFRGTVAAQSVTFVFSSYYLNNPASAFGHTFLRLNKTAEPRTGKRFELMDYGIDYAADVDTGNALLYAFKGLFGLFHGTFKNIPYFYKVREYGDYESRDLWEYDLDLPPEEVERLVAHLWEMGSTWFDYYYLDENCSYHILGALEAASPRLELISHVPSAVVLPADTVKALYRNPGLVRAVHYRPSVRTQFEARIRDLSGEELAAVADLARRPDAALPPGLSDEQRARALDAALDHVDVVYARDLVDGRDAAAAREKQGLMERRASIPVQSADLQIPTPFSRRPDVGHGSRRAGLLGGASRADGPLGVVDLRLHLHDLADPPDGYPLMAQIEFLPMRLRLGLRDGSVQLDELLLVRAASLSDFGRFNRHVSWSFRFGTATVRDGGCRACLAAVGEIGGGVAVAPASGAFAAWLLADTELLAGPDLAGIAGKGVRLGLGPSAGLLWRAGSRLSLVATGRLLALPWSFPRTTFDLRLVTRLHLGVASVEFEVRKTPLDVEGLAGLLFYL